MGAIRQPISCAVLKSSVYMCIDRKGCIRGYVQCYYSPITAESHDWVNERVSRHYSGKPNRLRSMYTVYTMIHEFGWPLVCVPRFWGSIRTKAKLDRFSHHQETRLYYQKNATMIIIIFFFLFKKSETVVHSPRATSLSFFVRRIVIQV